MRTAVCVIVVWIGCLLLFVLFCGVVCAVRVAAVVGVSCVRVCRLFVWWCVRLCVRQADRQVGRADRHVVGRKVGR